MKNQVKLGSNKKTSSFEQLSADIGKILILEWSLSKSYSAQNT